MGVGQIAGLIAAIAFAVLAGFMIYPLIRLGKLFDQIADTDLYGSVLGKPVIKIASFFDALKSTAQSFVAKKSTGRDSVEGSGQQDSKAQ